MRVCKKNENIKKRVLYKDYVLDNTNYQVVQKVLDIYDNIGIDELELILAYCSLELYKQKYHCNGKLSISNNKINIVCNNDIFTKLILDLIEDVNIANIDIQKFKEFITDANIEFIEFEDTLGFLYMSLREVNHRKEKGIFYTPKKVVDKLIKKLVDSIKVENRTFCDTACGTGNFIIGLFENSVSIENLYGQDLDSIAVALIRINVCLLDNNTDEEILYSHFICGNTLLNSFENKFSVILGNPPWGYKFKKEELKPFLDKYNTANTVGVDSYDLFIEKALSMLDKDGILAYVVPESILNVASHTVIREILLNEVKFKSVIYLQESFDGVQCPSIILITQKQDKILNNFIGCKVELSEKSFVMNTDRELDSKQFCFNMTDDDYSLCKKIKNLENAVYLKDNAKFALGIVTGNNKKYISNVKKDNNEVILRGTDISKYKIKSKETYIELVPSNFQQVAPNDLYRADEKLFYRFISKYPTFAYDDEKRLSLNSCNILIPEIDGLNIKYILAILNSSVTSFYIRKRFNSLKLLRSHIEVIPIPLVDIAVQNNVIEIVDLIMKCDNSEFDLLYKKLDEIIFELYNLSEEEIVNIVNF